MFKTVKFESYVEELECDIGEQEFIVCLTNGEEHTLKFTGYVTTHSYYKSFYNVKHLNILNDLTLMHWVPIRIDEYGKTIDSVPSSAVAKIKTGLYTPKMVKYSVTKERAVQI
jgi:hypothetical protein